MQDNNVPLELAKNVVPKALSNYLKGLGWQPLPMRDTQIEVYKKNAEEGHQIIVPLNEGFDDYAESVAEAIKRVAFFEKIPASEILNHLLLPPSDVLRIRNASDDSEDGTIGVEQAAALLEGARRLVLSVAHSIVNPQKYHPRLGRAEGEQLIQKCRVGQTERGSFTMTLSCPLHDGQGQLFENDPFSRKVTMGMYTSLKKLADAVDRRDLRGLKNLQENPLISANFCDAVLLLRPVGEKAKVTVSFTWSKALASPFESLTRSVVELNQDVFSAAEYLSRMLRAQPVPQKEAFVGYVETLKGEPVQGEDAVMAGEVHFSVFVPAGETIRAKAELNPVDYKMAGQAHLEHKPVYFQGVLMRGSKISRIESISMLRIVESQP